MIIIRDQINYWRVNVSADTLEIKDCDNAELALTVEDTCGDYSLFSFTPSCDLQRGSYDYELTNAGEVVKTGMVTIR